MSSNALSYLLRTKFKNSIRATLRKPSRLILIIVMVALLALTIVGGNESESDPDRVLRDISELTAGLNALLILIFSVTFTTGIENGGTFFKMSDVNFLFPSPINKRNILFYAMIQQMGATLFVGIFILFQYTALHSHYGLSILGLIFIFLVYSTTVFLSQCTAMFLYTYISDSDKKKRTVKYVLYAVIAALVAYAGINVLQDRGNIVSVLVAFGNSLPVRLFPFAGWLGTFAAGILTENYILATVGLAVTAAVFGGLLFLISRSTPEYYEDVLAAAENTTQRINSQSDGAPAEQTPRHIKVKKTGIGKGNGANTIFYKHRLESRRSSKLFLSTSSILFGIMTIVFAFFMKSIGVLPILAFSVYMLIFSLGTNRFAWELTKPYVYLIPEPPLKKMIYTILETLPSVAVESIVILVPVCIIVGAAPLEYIMSIIARISFAVLFISGNIAIERIWGGSLSKVVGVLLYFLLDLILALPGIILAIVLSAAGIIIVSPIVTVLIAVTVLNIPIAILVLFLCRNMLIYAEI